MIPKKKKTAEEIAALREELGIPDELPAQGAQRTRPVPPMEATNKEAGKFELPRPEPELIFRHPNPTDPIQKEDESQLSPAPTPKLDPDHPDAPVADELKEPIVHLNIPVAPIPKPGSETQHSHTLRKKELPLAPAPSVTYRTTLPNKRHSSEEINQTRKRENLAKLNSDIPEPAAQLRAITANLFLLIPAYILALGAGVTIWQHFHYITPLALLAVASLLAVYIFLKKIRSRHHAAFLFIIILMTLVFGGLHYAPLFQHAP